MPQTEGEESMKDRLRDVLLGLIDLHPGVTGYELRAVIRRSTGYFYTASLSQIYPALKALHLEGLVTFETLDSGGRQDRKAYTITDDGRVQLRRWLDTPLALDDTLAAFRELLLRLTFMPAAGDDALESCLRSGLDHFRREFQRVKDNALAIERDYVHLSEERKSRYFAMWQQEQAFLEEDLSRKVAWIEGVLQSFSFPAAASSEE